MENKSGLQRVELKSITSELNNALIVGIIIAKQRPRKFDEAQKGERAVWNFTIRDSPLCYINVTCWSSKDIIFALSDKFHVGDVVDIVEPVIEIRKLNGHGELFRPMVTSPYSLTLNDVTTQKLLKHEGNCNIYYKLLHFVTKPIVGAITFVDIHNLKHKIDGVDIMGIVRIIGKVRQVKTRGGTEQQVREVVLLDQTSSSLRISLWDPELIARAGTWKISMSVLFITDVRCDWSDFSQSMVATLTSRTVVTEDPLGLETENLRNYAKKWNPFKVDNATLIIPDTQSIQNVMNIQQVLDKTYSIGNLANVSCEERQFTALLYAVITHLDLDGLTAVVTNRCSRCDTPLTTFSSACSNEECVGTSAGESSDFVPTFDLRMTLTDQTGSLVNCRLGGQIAESILQCSVRQFLDMDIEEKSMLKWKFLMERCAICIHATCMGFRNPVITILSCFPAAPSEVANRIPHY